MNIQIVKTTDPTQLKVLMKEQYIELLPGPYTGESGNLNSIYFEEEVFGFFETIIERHNSSYSHYAFTEIAKPIWLKIIKDLTELSEELDLTDDNLIKNKIGFIFKDTESKFLKNLEVNKRKLNELTCQFVEWIQKTLREYNVITILGL
jgi:hypothetical protein